ncbi:MAG: glycoside hydrolase family 32 protein [Kiritimatiellaeota bacterium]|nr:glycoside hydrolase family 32 protein [Kiritimatiellota bacterium]
MRHRQFLKAAGIGLAAYALLTNTQAQEKIAHAGRTKFLLLDARIIASTDNAKLAVGTVKKHPANPLFGEDKPWEKRFDNLYANVIHDGAADLYKCWYSPFIVDHSSKGMSLEQRNKTQYRPPRNREMGVCYAVSRDGLKWEKAALDLVDFEGSKQNNLVLRGPHGAGVFRDPDDPDPQQRYKMFHAGDSMRFSADGLRWSAPLPCPDIHSNGDTHNNMLWAPELKRYVGLVRLREGGQRIVGRTESADLERWTKAVEVLRCNAEGQAYSMPVFRYADIYLGLVAVFRTREDRVHTELAWSPDTITWHRIEAGTPLIANSPKEGDYDWGCVYAAESPILLDDEIRIYYGGSNGKHTGWRDGFLCLATLRTDGWAGYEPENADQPATILTKPVTPHGPTLRLTADVAPGGSIRVAIEGDVARTLAACRPVTTTVTDAPVSWQAGKPIGAAPVALRFELTKARLYSFRFGDTQDPPATERQRAQAALEAAIPRAATDATRPVFHFRPPARWMNDICGAIFYKGYHHIFYQNNPYSDDQYGWGWGHARSKDLVHWEELPFALVPMKHRGELRCNSGCVTLDGNGRPMIFYTFVPQNGRAKRTQWAALPLDDELFEWCRVGDGPLMEIGKNGVSTDKAEVHPSWSDPYVFKSEGRTFVTFKKVRGMVCEAQNQALTEWKAIGRMDGVEGECPNVVKMGNKWVIIRSTNPMSYLTGDLALKGNDIRFDADGPPRTLDHGFGLTPPKDRGLLRGLYGTSTYEDDRGRTILLGWISGFKTGRGWNGCMSLPRMLTLDASRQVLQTPAPELETLRQEHTQVAGLTLANEFKTIEGAQGKQLELVAEFIPDSAAAFGLKLRSSRDGQRAITLRYADGTLNVAGTAVPLKPAAERPTLKLHVFLDRSVLEVFINDGQAAVTRVEYPDEDDLAVGVFAENGKATLKSLDVWRMKAIW